MKCFSHTQTDAVAICTYCGKGLCKECAAKSDSGRISCSQSCSDGILQLDRAVKLIRQKTLKGYRLAAYFLFGAGGVFGVSGIIVALAGDSFSFFLIAITIVFVVAGFALRRFAARSELEG